MQTLIVNNKNTYTGTDLNFSQRGNNFLNFAFFFHNFGYTYTNDTVKNEYSTFNENELTSFCMKVSEKSLEEGWDNEDDERWNSF